MLTSVLLKEKTRDIHLALHDHSALKDLLNKSVSFEYYMNVISKFYSFHQGIERAISNEGQQTLYERFRSNTLPLLRDDCVEQNNLNFHTSIDFSTQEAVWAYLYVKEGSALGGKVIHKTLTRNLNGYGNANSYFTSLSKIKPDIWTRFVETMNQKTEGLDQNLIVKNAQFVFKELYEWMSK